MGAQVPAHIRLVDKDGFVDRTWFRYLSNNQDFFNVKQFPFTATGNGNTDDTQALQSTADYVRTAGGGIVYMPPGDYGISSSVRWGSNTTVFGAGAATVIKALPTFDSTNIMFTNYNQSAGVLTDSNITFQDLSFLAPVGSVLIANVYIRKASVVRVRGCSFQNGSDATAFLSCKDTLVSDCRAYDFTNCAWDHWESPQQAKVFGCYAQTASTNQMTNFNPEDSTGMGGGAADGYILANSEFIYTGAAAIGAQLEPLAAGSTVRNMTITNNVFGNTLLAMRGDVASIIVGKNIFTNIAGNAASIAAYTQFGGTGANFVITGNEIIGSNANAGSSAIICQVNNYVIDGNLVTDGGALDASLDVIGVIGTIGSNSFATGAGGLGIKGQRTFANVGTPYNGVTLFVVDGLSGSNPLAGGGTGCLAVRQNGAWVAAS